MAKSMVPLIIISKRIPSLETVNVWMASLVLIDLLQSSRLNMNLFCKGLDSGYRPFRRRLPHESEQSCSAIHRYQILDPYTPDEAS